MQVQLSGYISDSLGYLSELSTLNLSNNSIASTIPDSLGKLSQLRSLQLQGNDFSGIIPPSLGQLSQLMTLLLNGNKLSGSIPSELENCQSLESLWLSQNELTGTIPEELANISTLNNLRLHDNRLNGPIPIQLGDLSNLNDLYLNDNELSGNLPASLGNLSNLRKLRLYNNKLTGSFPIEWEGMESLTELQLQNNQIDGSISDNINVYSDLLAMDLSSNQLDAFPFISDLFLQDLKLDSNQLSFDDLLPNIGNTIAFLYAPQDSIYFDTLIQGNIGESIDINLGIDVEIASNLYSWFKDDNPFTEITGSPILNFVNLQMEDKGIYRCEVTNPGAPELTLYSRPIQLQVICPISMDTIQLLDTICDSDSYQFGNQSLSESGIYLDQSLNAFGCDSLTQLNLVVHPSYEINLDTSLCMGNTLQVGNQSINQAGTYQIALESNQGCDSLINLELDFIPNYNQTIDTFICEGSSLQIGNLTFNSPIDTNLSFLSKENCDSVIQLRLVFAPNFSIDIDTSLCSGESIEIGGQIFGETGLYEIPLLTQAGCDSVINLNLTVIEINTSLNAELAADTIICEPDFRLSANLPNGTIGRWNSNSLAVIDNPSDPNTMVFELETGPNEFTWTLESTGLCPVKDSATIIVSREDELPQLTNDILDLGTNESASIDLIANDRLRGNNWDIFLNLPTQGNQIKEVSPGLIEYTRSTQIAFEDTLSYLVRNRVCPDILFAEAQIFILGAFTGRAEIKKLAFTPDGDGINDEFIIAELGENPEDFPDNELLVFNRWGQIVYQAKPYKNEWTGKFKNTDKSLPPGTYFFRITIQVGEKKIIEGQVTIVGQK